MNETILGEAEATDNVDDAEEKDATVSSDEKEADEAKEKEASDKKVSDEKSDDKGEAEKDEDSKADETDGPPDKYEDFTFPEGVEAISEQVEVATEVFKDLNLSQEDAQKLVDLNTKFMQEEFDRQQKAWDELTTGWKEKSTSDPEFGGTALEANMAIAKQGRDAFGGKEFVDMLETTGVGDHPEMVRFLFKLGKAVSEDSFLQGKASPGKSGTATERLFPDMNKE